MGSLAFNAQPRRYNAEHGGTMPDHGGDYSCWTFSTAHDLLCSQVFTYCCVELHIEQSCIDLMCWCCKRVHKVVLGSMAFILAGRLVRHMICSVPKCFITVAWSCTSNNRV